MPLRSHGTLAMNRPLVAAGLVDRVEVTLFPGGAGLDLELIKSRTVDGHTQELICRPTLHG